MGDLWSPAKRKFVTKRATYGRPYNLHKIKYLHTKKRRTYQKVWRFVYQKSDNIKHCLLLSLPLTLILITMLSKSAD